MIYKIDSTGRKSLPDLLQIKTGNSERTEEAVYTQVDLNSLSSFQWRPEPPHTISKIHVLLGGDSVTMVVANDSVVSYHLLCQSLSIRFSEEGLVEVYLTGVDKPFGRAAITPADILFLKRNEAVYLLIMTPGRDDGNIPAQLLYNVVMGL